MKFFRCHPGQAIQNASEILIRLDPEAAATADNGVDDGTLPASGVSTDKQPVLYPELGWTDLIFDQVIVDLD
ncbi:MAG: hypothetical protein P1V20_16740 [Verrucomicrobiales bacterium]|nr:hypothetical protein [Verrucomicrobiales bacterium]